MGSKISVLVKEVQKQQEMDEFGRHGEVQKCLKENLKKSNQQPYLNFNFNHSHYIILKKLLLRNY